MKSFRILPYWIRFDGGPAMGCMLVSNCQEYARTTRKQQATTSILLLYYLDLGNNIVVLPIRRQYCM